jgi:hypothetical protein
VKIEDWFKDGTTIVKSLRKGRGRNPYIDSTVKFRLQVLVNDVEVSSNYPDSYDFFEDENFNSLSKEEQATYIESLENVYTERLDSYTLPSLIIKIIKSMKKNGVVQVTTSRIDKL